MLSLFDAAKPKIAQRFATSRATRVATEAEDALRMESPLHKQLAAVLEHFSNYLASGDMRMHRDFLQAFLAMRAAEAQSPGAVMSTLAEIGDTAARVVDQLEADHATRRELVAALIQTTLVTSRVCNELVARDLDRKQKQCIELRANTNRDEAV